MPNRYVCVIDACASKEVGLTKERRNYAGIREMLIFKSGDSPQRTTGDRLSFGTFHCLFEKGGFDLDRLSKQRRRRSRTSSLAAVTEAVGRARSKRSASFNGRAARVVPAAHALAIS